jgi:hypothetical protein
VEYNVNDSGSLPALIRKWGREVKMWKGATRKGGKRKDEGKIEVKRIKYMLKGQNKKKIGAGG